MNPVLRLVSSVLASVQQSLRLLKVDLRQWAPRQPPVLVPIPIQIERRTQGSHRRYPDRGD